jgi:hypothetical protein
LPPARAGGKNHFVGNDRASIHLLYARSASAASKSFPQIWPAPFPAPAFLSGATNSFLHPSVIRALRGRRAQEPAANLASPFRGGSFSLRRAKLEPPSIYYMGAPRQPHPRRFARRRQRGHFLLGWRRVAAKSHAAGPAKLPANYSIIYMLNLIIIL